MGISGLLAVYDRETVLPNMDPVQRKCGTRPGRAGPGYFSLYFHLISYIYIHTAFVTAHSRFSKKKTRLNSRNPMYGGLGGRELSHVKPAFHETDTDTDSLDTPTSLRPTRTISSRGSSQGCRRVGRVGEDVGVGVGVVECGFKGAW